MSETTDVATVDNLPERAGQQSPPELIARAVESGASVEVMEKLLELHERWEANQARKAFDHAMAAIRAELPAIPKRGHVEYTTSKGPVVFDHIRLPDLVDAVQPIMAAHGLSFRWRTANTEGDITVACIISHEQGHSEEVSLSGPPDTSGKKNPIQSIASTVSYLQRYTIKAALGLCAAPDDDAQGGPDVPESEPELASDESLVAFSNAGEMVYGEQWPEKRAELVEKISHGTASEPEDLTEAQIGRLVQGINAKANATDVHDAEIPT